MSDHAKLPGELRPYRHLCRGPGGVNALDDNFQINLAREPDFSLGGAEVRPSAREIAFDGIHETVEPRVMQVLVALARRPGEVVSRDELTQLCWEGRIVGEDAINRCLAKVRRLTERMQGVVLETVPRVGYRLKPLAEAGEVPPAIPPRAWLRSSPVFAGIVAALLLLLLLFAGYRMLPQRGSAAAPTLAVLPFTSLNSGEEMHLFGKSVAASITDALNRVSLPLVSTAPFPADAGSNPAAVGRELGADYVISGSVRREGDLVRAFARIDQAEGGVAVYTRMFEVPATEMRRLPDLVAGGLAGAITWTIPIITREPDRQVRAGVLRAILSEDPRRGLEAARETLAGAPHSGIAQLVFALRSYNVFSHYNTPEAERRALIGPARAAAARAREMLPDFGEAYLPACILSATATPAQCEDLLRQGLAADPRSPWLPTYLAIILSEAGRLKEAGPLRASAYTADPFQPTKAGYHLYHLELWRRTNRPETEPLVRAGQLYWRTDPMFIELRFKGLVGAGEMAEAEKLLNDPVAGPIIEPPGREGPIRAILDAYRTRSAADLARARAECGPEWLPREIAVAACLTGLSAMGDLDGAFALAERVYPDRRSRSAAEAEAQFMKTGGSGYTRTFLFGDAAAPLRADPRFIGIAERTGMLDYWRTRRAPEFCERERAPVCDRLRGGGR